MRYIHFFFFLTLAAAQDQSWAQPGHGIEVDYDCRFNIQFDQHRLMVPFHARLVSSAARTYFHAVRDKSFDLGDEMEFATHPDTMFQVVKSISTNEILFATLSFSGKTTYYKDTLHGIDWMLLEERKRVDNIECFKAKAVFRGREYIAWYAPSIPVSNGPWKLGGLPGLIIEAYEVNEDLYFLARSVSYREMQGLPGQFADISKYPDFLDYVTYLKSTLSLIQASMSAQGQGDCLDCQTKSKVKLHLWEKVLD